MTTRFVPQILYTMASISLGMHFLAARKDDEDRRAYFAARIALLEDTAARLRAGVRVPDADLALLRRLAREPGGATRAAARGVEPGEETGWRDVLLGRKDADGAATDSERWDARDWEKGACAACPAKIPVFNSAAVKKEVEGS